MYWLYCLCHTLTTGHTLTSANESNICLCDYRHSALLYRDSPNKGSLDMSRASTRGACTLLFTPSAVGLGGRDTDIAHSYLSLFSTGQTSVSLAIPYV